MGKIKDLTGIVVGKLKVIMLDDERNLKELERYRNGDIKKRRIYWICKCECGNIKSICSQSLIKQLTKSCGCIQKQITSIMAKENNTKQNEYEFLDNGTVKVFDTKHENFFLIDEEDYNLIKEYCWCFSISKNGYSWWSTTIRQSQNKKINLHQLIMKQIDDKYVPSRYLISDHLNRNTSDNRRCNLELKTHLDNRKNLSKLRNNISGKTGVHYTKRDKKWVARICSSYNNRIQKSFNTFEEAVEQRIKWENEFGYIGE